MTTSTPELAVPDDILEIILQILFYEPDVVSLRACSLAGRRLRPLCQKLLFRTIVINTHPPPGPEHYFLPLPDYFINMLRESPNASNFIRHLEIRLLSPREESYLLPRNDLPGPEDDTPFVRKALARLTRLSIITSPDIIPYYLSGTGFYNILGQALSITDSLVELDVTAIRDFRLSLLRNCVTLKKLKVSRVLEEEEEVQETVVMDDLAACDVQRQALRCTPSILHLGLTTSINTRQILQTSHGVFDSGRIEELGIDWDFDNQTIQDELMDGWKQPKRVYINVIPTIMFSLHRFGLEAVEQPRYGGPSIKMFKCLEVITFQASMRNYGAATQYGGYFDPLPWIFHVLEQACESLRKVVLILDFSEWKTNGDMNKGLQLISWDQLHGIRNRMVYVEKLVVRYGNLTPEQSKELLAGFVELQKDSWVLVEAIT